MTFFLILFLFCFVFIVTFFCSFLSSESQLLLIILRQKNPSDIIKKMWYFPNSPLHIITNAYQLATFHSIFESFMQVRKYAINHYTHDPSPKQVQNMALSYTQCFFLQADTSRLNILSVYLKYQHKYYQYYLKKIEKN